MKCNFYNVELGGNGFAVLKQKKNSSRRSKAPICDKCATCSWETLTMLNPRFVAGEHGLFGSHESKYIQTICP